jgi:hypothetical protein
VEYFYKHKQKALILSNVILGAEWTFELVCLRQDRPQIIIIYSQQIHPLFSWSGYDNVNGYNTFKRHMENQIFSFHTFLCFFVDRQRMQRYLFAITRENYSRTSDNLWLSLHVQHRLKIFTL